MYLYEGCAFKEILSNLLISCAVTSKENCPLDWGRGVFTYEGCAFKEILRNLPIPCVVTSKTNCTLDWGRGALI